MNGAEKLLGKGDMLFFPSGYPKPLRVQGAFVSDDEVTRVVDFLKEHSEEVVYDEEVTENITSTATQNVKSGSSERDPYFAEAGRFVIEKEKGSIGMLQRYYKVGFNRAARIMDQLAEAKVVGQEIGTKPRKVLMTAEEFEEYLKNSN
jgi:S-DNA-T family DNA segregation ATPase FtsK/SpoIIIE